MKRINIVKLIFILFISTSTHVSAAGGGVPLLHMDVDLSNRASLQRGAKMFVNYCLSCHSAEFMRYNRIGKDLGISEEVLKANFMFGTDKVGDTMKASMSHDDAEQFFGVVPPDLSVIARARGADWLYTYFKTFYIDESRPFGVNNLVFKDVGMPNVLWQLQGSQRLNKVAHDEAGYHGPRAEDLELISHGSQTEEEFDQTVQDLVNFLVYLGEPVKLKRTKIGTWVLFYLFVLAIITYILKREYWRDIH